VISTDLGYVQGMNVLLGPFLYIMPELDSYYCCWTLFSEHIPSYVRKNLEGVHQGITLVGKCLKVFDLKLHTHLMNKVQDLRIFSLRYILTLMANVQPLKEVIRLWDGIFAFGAHLSIVVFCCYLINLREEILAESTGYK
jgi:cell cycle arrest protein BUB2